MGLVQLVEEYIDTLNQPISENTEELERLLSTEGISIKQQTFKFERGGYVKLNTLTLPITLEELNIWMGFSKDEYITNHEFFYLLPSKILQYTDAKDSNAGEIYVREVKGKVQISCEIKGHALGFLKAYAKEELVLKKPTWC